jgi:epoxyqueuosine reductase
VDEDELRSVLAALDAALVEAGFRYRVAGVEAMHEIDETMAMLRDEGLLSSDLLAEYGRSMTFAPPSELGEARSLIIVAAPSPAVSVTFQLDPGPLDAVIPPTYIGAGIRAKTQAILSGILGPAGYSVGRSPAPAKLLATRVGLTEYGRNNIAYVIGSGSSFRLDVYATDADLIPPGKARGGLSRFIVGGRDPITGHWSPPRRMGSCSACKACYHACPTGCIPFPGEAVMIDAKRCLTFINEREGNWPDWLDEDAHNSLVGCMKCQRACPANRHHLSPEVPVGEFDLEETATILENRPVEELPERLRDKLEALDLEDYSTVLGRNLLALRK